MTDQHRATPEQWAMIERYGTECQYDDSCILELRARVEALEKAQRPPHQDKLDRLIALDRDDPGNADSLVERVMLAGGMGLTDSARAAIREIASALIDWHDSDELVHTAWEAAKWLEQEANK